MKDILKTHLDGEVDVDAATLKLVHWLPSPLDYTHYGDLVAGPANVHQVVLQRHPDAPRYRSETLMLKFGVIKTVTVTGIASDSPTCRPSPVS